MSAQEFCVKQVRLSDWWGKAGFKRCGRRANHYDEHGRWLCGRCFRTWFRKRFNYHPSMEDWYHYHTGETHSDYEVYVKPEHRYSDDHREKMMVKSTAT